MADLVSKQTGDLTAGASWYNVENATRGVQLTHNTVQNTSTTLTYNGDAKDITGTNLKNCVGVLVFCNRQQAGASGTVKVVLSADSGTTETVALTIDAVDLPFEKSWVFFKFASPLALDGGTDYAIGVYGSVNQNANFYTDGTSGNWAHVLVWDDSPAGAPVATDRFFVVGNQTGQGAENAVVITMDETVNTDYGAVDIGNVGTLAYDTTSAYNPYLRVSGDINVWGDGVFNIGTAATPIPRDSIAVLEMDCGSFLQYGVYINQGGTFTGQGLSRTSGKNIVSCKLNTDEAVNSTSLGVDTDTGWLNNDIIAVALTTRTVAESEQGTLNGDAGASSLTVDGFAGVGGGLAYAHGGTAPIQAEVILLTRNVIMRATSASYYTYFYAYTTATVDIDWMEFWRVGGNSSPYYGVESGVTTGSFSMQYSSVHDAYVGIAIMATSGTGNTVNLNVVYNTTQYLMQISSNSGSVVATNNVLIRNSGSRGLQSGDGAGSNISGNTVAGGGTSYNIQIVGNDSVLGSSGFFDNIVSHGGAGQGFNIDGTVAPGTVTNLKSWRNNYYGMQMGTAQNGNESLPFTFDGGLLFGNDGGAISINQYSVFNCIFKDYTIAGDSVFRQQYGLTWGNQPSLIQIQFQTCTFGTATGIYVNHSAGDVLVTALAATNLRGLDLTFHNCKLSSTNDVVTPGNLAYMPDNPKDNALKSSKHNQQTGGHKLWMKYGTIETDATIYKTAAPSEKDRPTSATIKLISGVKHIAVADGQTLTPAVWVRESVVGDGADYNGNRIRLILRRNVAMGISQDVVLDTATVASEGAFEQLSGTTDAVTDDGVLEFYIDCDGTTGWINIDDWTVS